MALHSNRPPLLPRPCRRRGLATAFSGRISSPRPSLCTSPDTPRIFLQGTVKQKLAGAWKVDDGTGTVDVVAAPGGSTPGLQTDSVEVGPA